MPDEDYPRLRQARLGFECNRMLRQATESLADEEGLDIPVYESLYLCRNRGVELRE